MIEVLPATGVITVNALAEWLHTDPSSLQQSLSNNGIPVLKLSSRHNQKLVRLEDLRKKVDA
jgi:hypothetical protein